MFTPIHEKVESLIFTLRNLSLILILIIFIFAPKIAPTQISNNVELLGTLDPAEIKNYGDIWGYVDPITEKEYALLCARFEGLYIVEVTNPQAPIVASFVPQPEGSFDTKDVKTHQNYAYVVHQSGPLQIIDLSDPENPTDTTFTNQSLAKSPESSSTNSKEFTGSKKSSLYRRCCL